jgi:glycosyltransferase involved in cell wall biosynthesis
VSSFIKELNNKGVTVCHVPIPRKITDVKGITESLTQVKKMCNENQYDLLHCHSPIGSVIARLAARKARKHGTKVIYTAHGFHFYKGAPKRNWIIFYPIEKICSRWTDVLITINKEDFEFAQKHMRAGVVKYIPGVGVDTKQFRLDKFDKVEKRAKFGISEDDMVILSVGELNQNKNQEVIIRAMGKLNNPKLHYFIAGKGVKEQYLVLLAEELGVNLHLLGYRTDVVELLNAADIFALPSFREGLSVALMEAMAAGLPCVASDIRGNQDLIDMQEGDLCNPVDADAFADRIRILSTDSVLRDKIGKKNQQKVQEFDTSKILKIINEIYFA